jgi:hypothetical protein
MKFLSIHLLAILLLSVFVSGQTDSVPVEGTRISDTLSLNQERIYLVSENEYYIMPNYFSDDAVKFMVQGEQTDWVGEGELYPLAYGYVSVLTFDSSSESVTFEYITPDDPSSVPDLAVTDVLFFPDDAPRYTDEEFDVEVTIKNVGYAPLRCITDCLNGMIPVVFSSVGVIGAGYKDGKYEMAVGSRKTLLPGHQATFQVSLQFTGVGEYPFTIYSGRNIYSNTYSTNEASNALSNNVHTETISVQQKPVETYCNEGYSGTDYYSAGVVTFKDKSGKVIFLNDHCLNDNIHLVEYGCDEEGILEEITFSCPDGCSADQCISPVSQTSITGCLDTDGDNPFVRGATIVNRTGVSGVYHDNCELDDITAEPTGILIEHTCEFPNGKRIDCSYGCRGGGCLSADDPGHAVLLTVDIPCENLVTEHVGFGNERIKYRYEEDKGGCSNSYRCLNGDVLSSNCATTAELCGESCLGQCVYIPTAKDYCAKEIKNVTVPILVKPSEALPSNLEAQSPRVKSPQPISCKNSCLMNNDCIPIGERTSKENKSVFCSNSGDLILQKPNDAFCNQDYECLVNKCMDGRCTQQSEQQKQKIEIPKKQNFISRIFSFIGGLFGFGD